MVGSIALDSLQGGRFTDELGGSALYFSLAASRAGEVRMMAPVGEDAAGRVRSLLACHPAIEAELEVMDAPTYRWFSESSGGRNLDLGSQDSIYDLWSPQPPMNWEGWAFLGSMRPDRQLEAARVLAGCELLAADAMRSYLESAPDAAREVLELVDWYFCNEEEFAALGGKEPEAFLRRWRLDGLVLKHGPAGSSVYTDSSHLHRAARPGPVVDTTGAGDALAGGMLARWRQLGGGDQALEESLESGLSCAALAISEVGLRALARCP